MPVPNRIRVEVLGTPFFLSTTEPEAYIRNLESRLNDELHQLLAARPTLSLNDALVLLCFNALDGFQKSESNAEHMRGQLSDYLADAAKARTSLDEAKQEIARLKRELAAAKGHHA